MPAPVHADDALDAGGFGSWISVMLGALRAGHGAEEGGLLPEEADALRVRFHALSVKQRGRIWRPARR